MNVPVTVNDLPWIAAGVGFFSLILLLTIAYWAVSASDTPVRFRSWLPSWLRVSLKVLSVASGVAFVASVFVLVHHANTENAAVRELDATWRSSVQEQVEQSLMEQYAISDIQVDDENLDYGRPISDLRVPAENVERKWARYFVQNVIRNDPFSAPSIRVATEEDSVHEFGVVFDEKTQVATLIGISEDSSPAKLLRGPGPETDTDTLLKEVQP